MAFTHLQVRTGYSFYQSTIQINTLVERAKELAFSSLAITDENVLHGAISFYQACKRAKIKPIIGMTTNIFTEENIADPIVLLAKDNVGYEQLMELSSRIHLDEHTLRLHEVVSEHLICILPIATSRLGVILLEQSSGRAKNYIMSLANHFVKGNFYLGISDHYEEKERAMNRALLSTYEEISVPVVALQDVRYLDEDDYEAFDCLRSMDEGRRWVREEISEQKKHRHFRSAEQMISLFQGVWPEAVENSEKIARQCNVTLNFHERRMPSFPVPNGEDAFTYLKRLCVQGAKEKYGKLTKDVEERLSYELQVIHRMEFSDYFLIVADFVAFAKKRGIFVGPGRGSSAGSIVAYVLNITDVDPLHHELLFERFLNPERTTMPDIDIDFSDHRREEVIEYIRKKYGEQYVAQIITFGTFGARSVLRELIKTIGISYEDERFIFQHIPSGANRKLKDYLLASEELLDYVKQSERLKTLFSIAHTLEGLPRHRSTHAAGVVISDENLMKHTPLILGSNDVVLTQYAMEELETIGLLKFDLLGLRNLSLIENIVKTIEYQTKDEIDIHALPEKDEKTYELLRRGQTNGIFQLESTGMKRVLRQLKPAHFEDIIAVNALYRPGPMDFIPTYINRKHKREKVTYPHKDLMGILQPTYGVLVYQEQIIQMTHKMAGFSYGEADLLRRAITSKNKQLMDEQKDQFITGCLKNGYEQNIAEEIFSWILRFANYGFPKSHAAAYSKISYMLAYLKANYPAHFFAELISAILNDHTRVNMYIQEARSLGITIGAPSINESIGKYTAQHNHLQIGLLAIKGINFPIVQEIIRARKDGPFKNLFDFCLRVKTDIVNRTAMENLILSGTFDELYPNRASLLATLDQALEQGELFKEFSDQESLFEFDIELEREYEQIDDFPQLQKLATEKELIGLYVSSHPLKEYRSKLKNNDYISIFKAKEMQAETFIKCAAIIEEVRTIRTRKGEQMAFLTLSDETSEIDAVVFPRVFLQVMTILEEETIVFIRGKMNMRNNQKQLIVESLEQFSKEKLRRNARKRVFIKVTKELHDDALHKLREVAKIHPGRCPIIIYSEYDEQTYQLSNRYHVSAKGECLSMLENYFGKEHVVLK
ncbi:MAG TPA: DNA polymerase III subunit alpha [Bacillota bacterium]|nr:DNA polymerase III subunit alpha [Bacillota bacterium]